MKKSEIIDSIAEMVQDSGAPMRGNIGRWVNFTIDDLASRGYLHSLKREESANLLPGSGADMNTGRNYDLNSDTDKVYCVFIPSLSCEARLKKVNDDEFLNLMMTDGFLTMGKPQYYTIFGNRTLRLHPIPSSDYAPDAPTLLQKLYVWKYKDPAHLTETDDITEFKTKHLPLVVEGGYVYGSRFDDLGDFPAALARYEKMITRLFGDQYTDFDRVRQTAYNDY